MDNRPNLQTKLEQFTENVYFQPPESMKLIYPAIVFKFSKPENTFADNKVYKQSEFYEVTVIDRDPDRKIAKQISRLPKTRFVTSFVSDNLYHEIYTIYY